MKLGAFLMPSHPPERGIREGIAYDLAMLRLLDRLGFDEAWIGEHFTAPWEPCPAPDLLIASAPAQTSKIVLAPGAHLLPYHHPIELAHREHMQIIRAIRDRNSAEAERLAREHVRHALSMRLELQSLRAREQSDTSERGTTGSRTRREGERASRSP